MNYKDWLRDDATRLMPLNHDWVRVRRSLETEHEGLPESQEMDEAERSFLLLLLWCFTLPRPRDEPRPDPPGNSHGTSKRH
jgi:hypothetical protein